jgi:hypothetical protein
MSAEKPTPNDLRTIADNLHAEGQTSRAEVLRNAAAELASLRSQLAAAQAEANALREALEAVRWEHSYDPDSVNANGSGFVVRCAFCDVLRDDVQSGADKHADGCKVAAALAQTAKG